MADLSNDVLTIPDYIIDYEDVLTEAFRSVGIVGYWKDVSDVSDD